MTADDTTAMIEAATAEDHAATMREAHPSVAGVLRFFAFGHLPPHLRGISVQFCDLACQVAKGPSNPETTVALRKLLEAKDAAVRAVLP